MVILGGEYVKMDSLLQEIRAIQEQLLKVNRLIVIQLSC